MTGVRDWPAQGVATDTLSDRRPAAADDISIPEPRRGDDWPGAAPPAGWFLNPAKPASVRGRKPEPEGPLAPVVFGPSASPWLRAYHMWADSGVEWEQLTPPLREDTRRQAEPRQPELHQAEPRQAEPHQAEPRQPQPEPHRPSGGRRSRPPGRHARPPRSAQTEQIEHQYANLLGAPVAISPQDLDVAPTTEWSEQDETLLLEPSDEPARPRMLFGHRVMAMGVPIIVLTMVGALAVA